MITAVRVIIIEAYYIGIYHYIRLGLYLCDRRLKRQQAHRGRA